MSKIARVFHMKVGCVLFLTLLKSTIQAEINLSDLAARDFSQLKGRKEIAVLDKELKEHLTSRFMYAVAYCSSKAYDFNQKQSDSIPALYFYNHARELLGRTPASCSKDIDHAWLQEVYDEAALFEWIDGGSYKIPSPTQISLLQDSMNTVGLDMPLLIAASDSARRGQEDFRESEVMIHNTPGSMTVRPALIFSSDPDKELWQAIVYHELGHFKNNDLLKAYSLGLYNGKNGINYELASPNADDVHKALMHKYLQRGMSLLPSLKKTHIGDALSQELALDKCQKALKEKGRLWESFTDDEDATQIVYSRKLEELADLFCLKTLLENGELSTAFRYIQHYALHLLRKTVDTLEALWNDPALTYTIAVEYDPHPSDTERALYGLGFLAEHIPDLSAKLREWEQLARCLPIETIHSLNYTQVKLLPGAKDVRRAFYSPSMMILWEKQIAMDTYDKTFTERILYLLDKIETLSDKEKAHYYYKALKNLLGTTKTHFDLRWLKEVKKETEYLHILETLKANLPTPLEEKLIWDSARALQLKSALSFIAGKTKEELHTAGFFEIKGKNQKGLIIENHDDLDIYLMGLYTQLGILEDNTDVKIGHVFLVPDLYKNAVNSPMYQESIQKTARYFTLGLNELQKLATTKLGALIAQKLALPEAQAALANNATSLYLTSSSDATTGLLMQITRSLEQKTILYALENLWRQRGTHALLTAASFMASGMNTHRPLIISGDNENISAIEIALYILGFLSEHTTDLYQEVVDWQSKGYCYPSKETHPMKHFQAHVEAHQRLSQGARDVRKSLYTHAHKN